METTVDAQVARHVIWPARADCDGLVWTWKSFLKSGRLAVRPALTSLRCIDNYWLLEVTDSLGPGRRF